MEKKKNPDQEEPPVEEQEIETPTEQEETPAQEEQPQDREPEEQEEDPEGEEEEESEENPTDGEEEPQEQTSNTPAQETDTDETAALRTQLLNAQGRLAAYAAGVAPDMVDDAVTLAMAEAAKSGEITETSVNSAMDAVLKRHPEWKADSGKKRTGGFKIGADRDSSGSGKPSSTETKNVKRWNRFK